MKEVVVGERKAEYRPYYASFWMLDHKNGGWSVHETKQDAMYFWRNVLEVARAKPSMTWVKCAERQDLIEWMNIQRGEDMKRFNQTLDHEKRRMINLLVGSRDGQDDGN